MERIEQFTGEMLLCGLLGELVYQPPNEARLQALVSDGVFDESPLGDTNEHIRRGIALLQAWGRDAWERNQAQAMLDLQADYLRLFAGAGKLLAPPWESVYFSDEQQLFQEQTLKVRNWYRKYGLRIENLHREPDDHIGLELGFLARLAQLTVAALVDENDDAVHELVRDQSTFLNDHLLRWAPQWCDKVQEHAATDFYRGLAALVRGTLEECRAIVQAALPTA